MSDLARIAAALDDSTCEPWFPELTELLTAKEWKRLQKEFGITPETYSTGGVLRRSAIHPKTIFGGEGRSSPVIPSINIEAVQNQWADTYQAVGVRFYSPDEIQKTSVMQCIADAFEMIDTVPSLRTTVQHLARSLHIIKPPDEAHDISFSEPHIPFSIFVSVFEKRFTNDAARVAEAIVHEAMHLQLTLIEQCVPLVRSTSCRHFSPWRREMRNSQALVHALYVFRVVDEFLGQLVSDLRSNRAFVEARRLEISSQIKIVRSFKRCRTLTPIGRRFVTNILTSASSSQRAKPSKKS